MQPELLPHGARILIIRLSSIGDVLHATSVTQNLKRLCPDCHITWLASPPASELLRNNPDIDKLLLWDRRPFDAASVHLRIGKMLSLLKRARHLMRAQVYDIVLDIQCLFLTGILARLSGGKRRIGIHELHEGNRFFMTEIAPATKSPHKIRHYMTALSPLGIDANDFRPGTVLRLPEKYQAFAENFWKKESVLCSKTAPPILLVAIQTTWKSKQPRPAVFAQALAPIAEKAQVIFIGSTNDTPVIDTCLKIMRDLGTTGAKSIAGKTNLLELAALMKKSDLLLCCDSGPLYIAEAVGLPTLSLWGPTLPNFYGPLTPGHAFLLSPHSCTACCQAKCRYETNRCIEAIHAERITRALIGLLDAGNL